MAKTYLKSEMTPDLLKLNLQYFFEAPAREYKMGIDEIVLSTERDEERWLRIMNHWHDFMTNPPVESTKLRDMAENLVKTATEQNIGTVLEVFDGLEAFISSSIKSDDEKITEVVAAVSKLKNAIYDGTASEEAEKKRLLLEERRAEEEKLEAERLKAKTSEQEAIDDLQAQIVELSETIEQMSKTPDEALSGVAARLVNEAKEAANRIADSMENQVVTERSEEVRHEGFDLNHLQDVSEFSLKHHNSFRT